MKPRIYRLRGIWHCASLRLECLRVGLGFTPLQAFQEWEAM